MASQALRMPDRGTGVIHDLGYRGYDGPRLGRLQIIRALTWHSFRSAWGLGRGVKGKVVPVLAFVTMCLPVLVNAVAVAKGGSRLYSYDGYLPSLRIAVVTIFIAAQAPELVVPRPAQPGPAAVLLPPAAAGRLPAGQVCRAHGCADDPDRGAADRPVRGHDRVGARRRGRLDQTRALISGLGVGLMWAVLMAAIGLVLASMTGRRAYSTGIVAISCVLTFFLAVLLIQAEGGSAATTTGARVAGLFSPFTILDGVRVWLGGTTQDGLVANPGRYGPLYGLLAVVLLAACLGGLAARYRKASQS